jgi:hypothetical protein
MFRIVIVILIYHRHKPIDLKNVLADRMFRPVPSRLIQR